MNQQQFERALKLFRQAAAADPGLAAAATNEGIALLNLQQFAAAQSRLEAVVRRRPGDAHAWYNLGLLHKIQGDSIQALDCFQHAQQLVPDDADALYFVGLSQSRLGKNDDAIASFHHALRINPFHASAEFGLARALQQAGQREGAREHLARFQHLTETKLGIPISLVYGDQGALSLAIETGDALRPSQVAIPVRFSDATDSSRLVMRPSDPGVDQRQAQAGSGACFFDLDNDGLPDLVLADNGALGGVSLFHNVGNGQFQDVTAAAGLDGSLHATACATGDYDNDGFTDLVLTVGGHLLLERNQGDGTLKNVTQASGLYAAADATSVSFVDYDHDGDLDILVASREPGRNALWRNNGNHTFTDVTVETNLAGASATFGITGTDFNNDRAIDLIFASDKPRLFINPREGKWNSSEVWATPPQPAVAMAILDFDKDGWMDAVLTQDTFPGITLWRNLKGRKAERVSLPITHWRRAWGVVALDYDNDGWIDLAAVGETQEGRAEIRLLRNLGPGGFKDVTREVGLDSMQLACPCSLLAADFDSDGDTDLLVTQNHGRAILLRNDGGNKNNFLRIALKGLNDNKSALGTKVEVFAGPLRQKWEISGAGYLSQSSTDLLAGLGNERRVDVVRMLWPTGVLQDETELPLNGLRKITEIDRRGSSCPTLFAWDGAHYRFIGDMIGSGVVGHWVGPGQRNIPDSTEYLKIEGAELRPRNGLLSLRFMEPLEEVVYLDQVRLLAIDHPADANVYPNEYFASAPPFPEFKVITSRNARPLAGAWDDHGNDVLELLRSRDRRYVGNFALLPFKGFTQSHSLRIELPSPYRGGPLRLLMYGYIEYFFANSMYAAWQAGINPTAPSIDVLDARHQWVRVVDDMGFPAGLPRTTVADLTNKVPLGAKQLRITTNLQIYWDQILVDTTPDQDNAVHVTDVPLAGARLAFHGYPRMEEGRSPGDVRFIYEDVSATGPYTRPIGPYTSVGDVRALLASADDRFVVFGSGDEVQLEFDPSKLPAVKPGWRRDYFFFADGYEKDMDFYASTGDTVAPLPFHHMTEYPYAKESYPQDDLHMNDLLDAGTRFFSDAPASSYQPHYSRSWDAKSRDAKSRAVTGKAQ